MELSPARMVEIEYADQPVSEEDYRRLLLKDVRRKAQTNEEQLKRALSKLHLATVEKQILKKGGDDEIFSS
jgi:hypothetical protein